jgi:tRNA (guanine9-N1)-methyltransferase
MSSLQATEQVEEVMPTTVDQDALPTSTPENQPVPYPHEKPDYNDPKYAGMSKRAIKRQFKQERWDATRDQRRDANKAKKKKKLELKRKMIEDGFLERGPPVKRIRAEEQVWSKLNVVIDCDFNSYMMEKEINSMQTQIGRCYTANRNSINPCPLTVTSFGGELQKVLDKKTPSRVHWKGIEFTSDSYLDRFEKDKLVYLSADSDNVAFELDENKVYIIGGIVDKNRHKGLCQKKAEEQGIPTAQLPIGEYLQLATRKVLTVNHGKLQAQRLCITSSHGRLIAAFSLCSI